MTAEVEEKTLPDAGEESDAPSVATEVPPDWNSDDEPPKDHEGDEYTCSRDGSVKKTICRVGRGLERPGQYDLVRVRLRTLELGATLEEGLGEVPLASAEQKEEEAEVAMGQGQLPLLVEFALKSMRVGEVAEVRGPAAFAAKASPLYGRSLRTKPGFLPKQDRQVLRKLRFLPVAPRSIAEQAKAALLQARAAAKAEGAGSQVLVAGQPKEATVVRPPMCRVRVELLGVDCVHLLTEDRSVFKRLVQASRSRRAPRMGDVVTFSVRNRALDDIERSPEEKYSRTLSEDGMPFAGLSHVLRSMKEGEHCVARLLARAAATEKEPNIIPDGVLELDVVLHGCARTDLVPVLPVSDMIEDDPACAQTSTGGSSSSSCSLRKVELHAGPERNMTDLEDGGMVLIGILAGSCTSGPHASAEDFPVPMLLSWRVGEGAVPRFLEAAVASMRLVEGAAFEVPAAAFAIRPTGPSYEGQTPLRRLPLGDLGPLLASLLQGPGGGGLLPHVAIGHDELEEPSIALLPRGFTLSRQWEAEGETTSWEAASAALWGPNSERRGELCLRLTLLAATEAPDVCLMDDPEQLRFLDLERAHGNALARDGRFQEASVAYSRALDVVRRTPLYKALFPTQSGRMQGLYSRDAAEAEKPPFEGLTDEEVTARRNGLIALHLNLNLCAAKVGKQAAARRHADIAVGADPENAKALFRRGQAAVCQGDYEDALLDLQRSAELMPQDRAIRSEIQSLQRRMREHKQVERHMFEKVFQEASKVPCQDSAAKTLH
mmetsp:Transcript_25687/g.45570  ORF Transcript_25687/g.45570 Transcript_25687/m.45570 type:complete len:774 (-) Transcript_25687:468-2789(-)